MSIAPHTSVLGVSEITHRRTEAIQSKDTASMSNYREETILHTEHGLNYWYSVSEMRNYRPPRRVVETVNTYCEMEPHRMSDQT